MSRDDIQKLLGGYATGTLTPEEQQALFEAALEDQELFDALAREEALREVLSDPGSRAHLLAAIAETSAPWYRRWGVRWMVPAAAMAAIVATVGVTLWHREQAPEARPMAKVELPALPQATPSNPPVLPPAPEAKRPAASVVAQLKLPVAAPAPAAPPPQAPALQVQMQAQSFSGSQIAPIPPPEIQQAQRDAFGTRFLPQQRQGLTGVTVPWRGMVTDTAGTGIGSARVDLKSLATGQVTTVSTNDRGEFRADAVEGGAYQVSVSAAGFRSTTASANVPVAGQPPDLKLQLEVGAAAQNVVVTGAVKDATGAAIPGASVAVKSLDTGAVVNTATDGRGEFHADAIAGGNYQISASKAGFQTATKNEVASAERVNLQLPVGSTAETVQVASASAAPAPMRAGALGGVAGAGGRATTAKLAKKAEPAPFDYQLSVRQPGGELKEVRENDTVRVGAELLLQFTPRVEGYIRIDEGNGRTLLGPHLLPGKPASTSLAGYQTRGRIQLRIYFSAQPAEEKEQTAPFATISFNIR